MISRMRSLFQSSNRNACLVLLNFSPIRSYSDHALPYPQPETSSLNIARELTLKKLGLDNLRLQWPVRSILNHEKVDYHVKNPRSIRQMYGEADLSELPVFQGGYINFGYWNASSFKDGKISEADRIAASKEMYRVIGDLAKIIVGKNVLEIGCGLGYGSSFISKTYQPKLVVGLDISPEQIARAKKHQELGIGLGGLRFTIGEAETMPFTDNSFDRIISVEAAQHFESIDLFTKEAYRVLKPDGELVFTSFFPRNQEGIDALNAIMPDYHIHGSQFTIGEITQKLSSRLDLVEVKSIGENVWPGFSKWLDQIGYQHQWSKIWPALYEKGLIDYVIFKFKAPFKKANEVNADITTAASPTENNIPKP